MFTLIKGKRAGGKYVRVNITAAILRTSSIKRRNENLKRFQLARSLIKNSNRMLKAQLENSKFDSNLNF